VSRGEADVTEIGLMMGGGNGPDVEAGTRT